jgi:hypothetical protein
MQVMARTAAPRTWGSSQRCTHQSNHRIICRMMSDQSAPLALFAGPGFRGCDSCTIKFSTKYSSVKARNTSRRMRTKFVGAVELSELESNGQGPSQLARACHKVCPLHHGMVPTYDSNPFDVQPPLRCPVGLSDGSSIDARQHGLVRSYSKGHRLQLQSVARSFPSSTGQSTLVGPPLSSFPCIERTCTFKDSCDKQRHRELRGV